MHRLRRTGVLAFAFVVLALAIWTRASVHTQDQVREVSVEGNNFAFSPGRIEVQRGDLVKIRFAAHDMPHSFTIDAYRIAKRAGAGQTVVFEFRADQAGTFPFYCNLTQDERCRQMRGELVVR